MKNIFSLLGLFLVACGCSFSFAANTAFAAPTSVPGTTAELSAGRLPIDLARGSLGARLQVRAPKDGQAAAPSNDSNRSAQGLISDDASLSYPLASGTTSMIVSLRKIDVLSRLNFINYGTEGKLVISASSVKLPFDSADWRPIAKGEKFAGNLVVGCDLGSLEARYLKIDFVTQTPGRISGLGVFGLPTIDSLDPHPASVYTVTANTGVNTTAGSQGGDVYFDFANLNTGAKVVSVSHGGDIGRAQTMLDGNVETSYTFDPTDPAPTVVVDLSVRRALNSLSCLYEAPAGRLDFYLVDNPHAAEFSRGATLGYIGEPSAQPVSDAGASDYRREKLADRKALCSVNTTGQPGVSRASADIAGASGRFLVAEFHPIATTERRANPKDFKDGADYKDFKDTQDVKDAGVPAGTEGLPFRVISLSAFGNSNSTDTINRIPNVPRMPIQPPGGGTTINPPGQGTKQVTP